MFARNEKNEFVRITPMEVKENRTWWQEKGLSYTSTGYGKKIPTSQMVRLEGKKWYRVYCAIWSNVGTCYIILGGQPTIVSI
jgi:hypothetical protein